jgi:hypothetical protein
MNDDVKGSDWEVTSIAQVGGVVGIGAGIYCFDFKSKEANNHSTFILVGGALGFGGSMGGGVTPSPSDFISNNGTIDLYSRIKCSRPFSSDDLDKSYAALSVLGFNAAYGYSLMGISSGLFPENFKDVDVSGWGTGVGSVGAIMIGVWKRLGSGGSYH